ncbi:MAG TPA: electron transport complex subunit RsxC [bacterium]|nr:electron transport complex subunit RsxC [bacterium]
MFKGGLKISAFKELSKEETIETFPCPEKVAIPLSQHTGLPAKPAVQKGDFVKEGQVIGEPAGFISSYVHSSISGKVTGIENRSLPNGKSSMSVIIESENGAEQDCPRPDIPEWQLLSPREITESVKQAGIVGMGGAAFPTFVKLMVPQGKKAEYVLLNGCECEPFLTADYRVMKENTDEVIEGLQIICKALSVQKAFIGIESNKKDLVKILQKALQNLKIPLDISLKILHERYPQGSEKHLIKSITGKEVPSLGLPIDIGCVVFNIQTALSIKRAVCGNLPLTERVLTVTGLVKTPKNLRVRIGTSVADILSHCGGILTDSRKLVIGGPMMGINITSPDVPVIKSTTGIIILPQDTRPGKEIKPCIRCSRCIDACPMNLVPAELGRYAENKNWQACKTLNVADCIECGCCSYICPSERPLVDLFKWAKAELRKNDSR